MTILLILVMSDPGEFLQCVSVARGKSHAGLKIATHVDEEVDWNEGDA